MRLLLDKCFNRDSILEKAWAKGTRNKSTHNTFSQKRSHRIRLSKFFLRATSPPALQADKITWKDDKAFWVDQWPLSSIRVTAALELVQEQLTAGYIEPSTSPWNMPIFVIRKKTGKWWLLQDLREINKTMVPMGALQPGLPSPVAIPKGYFKIDIKDCFFSIPLHPEDCKRFAFSVPIVNFVGPMPRFQWRVLPQGMANSPTLCQRYIAQLLTPFISNFPLFILLITWMIFLCQERTLRWSI